MPIRSSALLLGLALIAAGCGSEGPRRLSFPVELVGSSGQALANDHGYTVTLSKATLRLAALHFFSGEPLFATRLERIWRAVLGVRLAHAHPGHYQEGEALAELLAPQTVDLLATSTPLGEAQGVTGLYRSAQLTLGSDAAIGGSVLCEGTASKAGSEVAFSGKLTVSDKIVGVVAGDVEVTPPIRVQLKVDLARYLQRIDFSGLTGSGVVAIPPGSQAENAFGRGVVNTSAYSFVWITSQGAAR